VERAQAFAFR
jgi:transposase InsO family protein